MPTPLGNLRDVTLRAVDVLREAGLVVAEDSRVARRLLSALGITGKKIVRFDEHATAAAARAIVELAREQMVAVVTDAGMPGISDPGIELVRAARAAGIPLEVLPGPSALLVAAVLSGFELRRFSFEGFVPRTSRVRREVFARALASGMTTVWYEAPHRIIATLDDLASIAPQTSIFLGRELTKLHEQHAFGTPGEVSAALEKPVRGEIVLVLDAGEPVAPMAAAPPAATLDRAIDQGLAAGQSIATIAKDLAGRGYGERGALYARASARKKGG